MPILRRLLRCIQVSGSALTGFGRSFFWGTLSASISCYAMRQNIFAFVSQVQQATQAVPAPYAHAQWKHVGVALFPGAGATSRWFRSSPPSQKRERPLWAPLSASGDMLWQGPAAAGSFERSEPADMRDPVKRGEGDVAGNASCKQVFLWAGAGCMRHAGCARLTASIRMKDLRWIQGVLLLPDQPIVAAYDAVWSGDSDEQGPCRRNHSCPVDGAGCPCR